MKNNVQKCQSRLGKQLVEQRALSGRRKSPNANQNYVTGKTTAPSSANNRVTNDEDGKSSNGSSLCNYEKGINATSLFTEKESKATTK